MTNPEFDDDDGAYRRRGPGRGAAGASPQAYLHSYLDETGIGDDPKGPLFRTIGRGTGLLTRTPLPQDNAYAMVRRRAAAARIGTRIGNHSFRATGITAYLKNGGTPGKRGCYGESRQHAHDAAL